MTDNEPRYTDKELEALDRLMQLKMGHLVNDLGADVSFEGLRVMMLADFLVTVGVITKDQLNNFKGDFLNTQLEHLTAMIAEATAIRERQLAERRKAALQSGLVIPNGVVRRPGQN